MAGRQAECEQDPSQQLEISGTWLAAKREGEKAG